ncbi:thiamine phosphate synthase [Thermophagus sp. OGC60D27]|uniref:thiamine phosphate synthase n=1 Tax=Thermophagus sp. OGC60D27 TaxID=3458415 RepID=UPI004037964C
MKNYGVYVILTKPMLPHTTIAEICVQNQVAMLQLREKEMSDRELLKIARDLRAITRGTTTSLVINDRPDIALLCQADYLHLGQDDLPVSEARKIVGPMKIGLSTHSLEQARQALAQEPDYIGFGPIFPTNAKAKPDPPVGTNQLEQVLAISDVPVVAIGGIFPENIGQVIAAGAQNIAMVRHFMQTTDFETNLKQIQKLIP